MKTVRIRIKSDNLQLKFIHTMRHDYRKFPPGHSSFWFGSCSLSGVLNPEVFENENDSKAGEVGERSFFFKVKKSSILLWDVLLQLVASRKSNQFSSLIFRINLI